MGSCWDSEHHAKAGNCRLCRGASFSSPQRELPLDRSFRLGMVFVNAITACVIGGFRYSKLYDSVHNSVALWV